MHMRVRCLFVSCLRHIDLRREDCFLTSGAYRVTRDCSILPVDKKLLSQWFYYTMQFLNTIGARWNSRGFTAHELTMSMSNPVEVR